MNKPIDKPTRSQWRGYAVLGGILLVLLLLLLLWPISVKETESSDNSELAEAVARYGNEIIEQETTKRDSYRQNRYYRDSIRKGDYHESRYTPRTYPYDTLLIDINTADTARLRQLRGIGPVFAARIVKYRTLLGGFVDTEQLLEVYGITTDLFTQIEPHVDVSHQEVKKLPINTATLDELRRHPYLDYYQARAIVDYRNTVGPIRNNTDLIKINLIDESTARKITPYIQYN